MSIPGFPRLVASGPSVSATGGDIYSAIVNGVTYTIHRFESSGTLQVLSAGEIEYVVGGGGGGAGSLSEGGGSGTGGGGGGMVIVSSTHVTPGNYNILVGAGGSGSNGGNSEAFGVTAGGGGKGGNNGSTGSTGSFDGGVGGSVRGSGYGGGGGGSGGPQGYRGGDGTNDVNGPGGSGGGARAAATASDGGVIFDPFPTVSGQNGVVGVAGAGYDMVNFSGETFGIGGGGWGGPYYASYPSGYTTYWGSGSGNNGSAPDGRCGGGNGRTSVGGGASGGDGVVYVRYRS